MVKYIIDDNIFENAKELGIKIRPSCNRHKKLDIFDYHNNFIFSIGNSSKLDFYQLIHKIGFEKAFEKRRKYRIKNWKNQFDLYSKKYYVYWLLWF
jgi:hypothetical protein